MFDDLNKNEKKDLPIGNFGMNKKSIPPHNITTTTNNQSNVEDIFSDQKTETVQNVENERKESSMAKDFNNDLGINSLEIEQQNKRKIMVLLLMFMGLIAIGWGTYYGFGKIVKSIANIEGEKKEEPAIITDDMGTMTNEIEETKEITEDNSQLNETIQSEEDQMIEEETDITDTDKDGLTDVEEIELGMDIYSVDSDMDGLFDREEVKIYKTDPLNPDTDADGFSDGEEVKAGYNPKGSGKILNINRNQN